MKIAQNYAEVSLPSPHSYLYSKMLFFTLELGRHFFMIRYATVPLFPKDLVKFLQLDSLPGLPIAHTQVKLNSNVCGHRHTFNIVLYTQHAL